MGGRKTGHFGKGPKGYTRSDERLKEEVSDRLMQNAEIDASNITVQVKDGEVTLEGTVDDRMDKRLAEDLVEDIMGVKDVTNRLKVQRTSGQGEASEGDGSSQNRSAGGGSTHSGSSSQQPGKHGKSL